MDGSAIGGIRTRMLTGAGRRASGKTDLRTFELRSSFCSLRAIPTHPKALPADGNAIVIDCEIIFVDWRTAAFAIQINEWLDVMVTSVFIVSHGIMG